MLSQSGVDSMGGPREGTVAISQSSLSLPTEIMVWVMHYLTSHELSRSRKVCQSWKRLIDENIQWLTNCDDISYLKPLSYQTIHEFVHSWRRMTSTISAYIHSKRLDRLPEHFRWKGVRAVYAKGEYWVLVRHRVVPYAEGRIEILLMRRRERGTKKRQQVWQGFYRDRPYLALGAETLLIGCPNGEVHKVLCNVPKPEKKIIKKAETREVDFIYAATPHGSLYRLTQTHQIACFHQFESFEGTRKRSIFLGFSYQTNEISRLTVWKGRILVIHRVGSEFFFSVYSLSDARRIKKVRLGIGLWDYSIKRDSIFLIYKPFCRRNNIQITYYNYAKGKTISKSAFPSNQFELLFNPPEGRKTHILADRTRVLCLGTRQVYCLDLARREYWKMIPYHSRFIEVGALYRNYLFLGVDRWVEVWDLVSRKQLQPLQAAPDGERVSMISVGDRCLTTGFTDGTFRRYYLAQLKRDLVQKKRGC